MLVWLEAARPRTLWASICPVVIGNAIAFRAGRFSLRWALVTLLGALLIQVGTNFANDYYDWKKGADNADRQGPRRATQAGLVSPTTMRLAMMFVFALAGMVGLLLTWHAGWPVLVIAILAVLFGLLYTAGPYPLAYVGLGDLFALVFFGPVAVGGTYYVQAGTWQRESLLLGLAPGLISVAVLVVNNLRDIKTDARANKRTLAVRFGATFARVEYSAAVIVAPMIPLLASDKVHPATWQVVLPFLTILLVPSLVKTIWREPNPGVLNRLLARTARLLLPYTLLFSVGQLL